jgi:L-amino acid N-acyltransferase YncA
MVTGLRIEPVDGDDRVRDWRDAHNAVIPAHVLSVDEVRERAGRNRLHVAYLGDVVVGCSTVRPPDDDPTVATVIARVLAAHRRHGFGEAIYQRALAEARALGAEVIDTVVLESNQDGLRFALARGFVEVARYRLPGGGADWIDLRLSPAP